MKYFTKLFDQVDTDPALARVFSKDFWHADTYLRDYPQGPFGETDSIILRFPPRSVHETEKALAAHMENFDQHENVWLPISNELPEIKDLVYWLMNGVRATRLGRVMVNRIVKGGRIYEHADTPVHALYWSRFHIVLHARPNVDFYCGDEMVNMKTGQVWFFKNEFKHQVQNNSDDDRIHLVIDLKCEDIK